MSARELSPDGICGNFGIRSQFPLTCSPAKPSQRDSSAKILPFIEVKAG